MRPGRFLGRGGNRQYLGNGSRPAGLAALADGLVAKSGWIVGGDGWAYDIDSGAEQAQEDVRRRWAKYQRMAGIVPGAATI